MLLVGYFYWALLSRLILTITLLSVRQTVDWRYPLLLYYNQIVGSLIKTYIFFRMNRQKWTRQDNKGGASKSRFKERFDVYTSRLAHAFSLAVFVTLIGSYIGLLSPKAFLNIDLILSK